MTPLLLALLFGAVEMGRYAYLGILIGNAARAGAAYASESANHPSDGAGICNAASYDFQGSAVACTGTSATGGTFSSFGTPITISVSNSCGCDNGGTVTAAAACTGPGTGSSACAAGAHWVVTVSVNASGKFSSLFGFPGIPNPLTFSRSSTMRVAQ